jgi:hypothetical protein
VGRLLSLLLAAAVVLAECRSEERAGKHERLETQVGTVNQPFAADESPRAAATAAGQADRYVIKLEPSGGSGVTFTFKQITSGIEVELDVRGLPRPETVYLAHIHRGTCAQAGGEERETDTGDHAHDGAEHIEQPLSPVRSGPEGRGSSTTMLWDTTLDREFSGDPEYVNVQAAGQGIPPPLACANLRDGSSHG